MPPGVSHSQVVNFVPTTARVLLNFFEMRQKVAELPSARTQARVPEKDEATSREDTAISTDEMPRGRRSELGRDGSPARTPRRPRGGNARALSSRLPSEDLPGAPGQANRQRDDRQGDDRRRNGRRRDDRRHGRQRDNRRRDN